MFGNSKNRIKELAENYNILTKKIEGVRFELMLLRQTLGSLKKDQVLYNHDQVEKLLVDFGNFLLSGERFKSIQKDVNFECVTDSDISNWKEKVKGSLNKK